jgi:hypothetical protein
MRHFEPMYIFNFYYCYYCYCNVDVSLCGDCISKILDIPFLLVEHPNNTQVVCCYNHWSKNARLDLSAQSLHVIGGCTKGGGLTKHKYGLGRWLEDEDLDLQGNENPTLLGP